METPTNKKLPKVLIAVPSVGNIPVEVVASLVNLKCPNSSMMFTRRMLVHHARNYFFHMALEKGHDYLFFVDDDVVLEPDTITRLIKQDKDIIMGVYPRRNTPHSIAAVDLDGNKIDSLPETKETAIEVESVGMGCTLIKKAVIEKMKEKIESSYSGMPFDFGYAVDKNGKETRLGEDSMFCFRAKQLGFKCWVDLTLRPLHLGLQGLQYNPKPNENSK